MSAPGQPELWTILRERVREWTGNVLSLSSRDPALEAVSELASRHRLAPAYLLAQADQEPAIRQALIERLVIRTTWFMREPDAILGLAAEFKKRLRTGGGSRVTLWSVACASGEEPYSLAMAFLEAGLEPIILATDVSDEARAVASAGLYGNDRVADLPGRWRQRFFRDRPGGQVEVARELRQAVTFLPLNLARSTRPPAGWGSFDVIVCRNVLLYFERRDASRIVRELAELTRDNGYLLLSAAEHPLAWSVRSLGWDRSNEAPWLRRRREISQPVLTVPSVSPPGDDKTPVPTLAGLSELHLRQREARAAARAGNTELALALGRRITADHPLDAGTHLQLGLLLKGAGRWHEAISALRRARFLFGDESWLAPYSLAICLDTAGETREALEAYRHACAVLEAGGPSGQVTPEDNEPMLAATVLESCRQRIAQDRGDRGGTGTGAA